MLMMLEQANGVPLDQVDFRLGDDRRKLEDRMGLQISEGATTDEENFAMLRSGELDAIVMPGPSRYYSLFPDMMIAHDPLSYAGLRCLINDPTTIAETYRRTRLSTSSS